MNILFKKRHIGLSANEQQTMLHMLHSTTIDQLISETIPENIRASISSHLENGTTEETFLQHIQMLAQQNLLYKNYIGRGYYPTHTPSVIKRNVLENPGWYTPYTPYQSEIAQGRLEGLFYFQSIICELTNLPIANASLLDEATAAAEAMTMIYAKSQSTQSVPFQKKFLMDKHIFPQTKKVIYTRARALSILIEEIDVTQPLPSQESQYFGMIVQYPNSSGSIPDYESIIAWCKSAPLPICFIADILSLCLLKPCGALGVDIAVGSTQRLGIPMGMGGPHAAFMACKEEYKRLLPGRIIGKSVDTLNNPCYRMALQTREQHIKREKATSNICTAQALLANMAAFYVIFHGSEGVKAISQRIASLTHFLKKEIDERNDPTIQVINQTYFDTLYLRVSQIEILKIRAEEKHLNFYYFEDQKHLGISLSELSNEEDITEILQVLFNEKQDIFKTSYNPDINGIPLPLQRSEKFLQDPIFNTYTTETKMMRFLHSLEQKDLALHQSMIPLGSCTMKLNAATTLMPLSMDHFSAIHPLAPISQTKGYQRMLQSLEEMLCTITEMDACSLQPNSGAQGEYAGLLCIKAYHEQHHESQRRLMLIPISAHGTNPASAKMVGFDILVIPCSENGAIDTKQLQQIIKTRNQEIAGLMITYPSTYGVFDENIMEVTKLIHHAGGLVYMDGANMNAQVGLTSPGKIGADVCHLNLHKTFAIPHGGGGPGMGPICVKKHLIPFLPARTNFTEILHNDIPTISAAPYGSTSILLIAYAYIIMMGRDGLIEASKVAILNANYMMKRLEPHLPILYKNKNGRCAHEFILDFRALSSSSGVNVEDIAKRLMDYGFHAPTVSFPITGTLMIEPTESEAQDELNRFCDAMIAICEEIKEIESGKVPRENNLLKNAPHSHEVLCKDHWDYPYTRERAAFPLPYIRKQKFWIPIGRINQAQGDRNLICSCTPIEASY